MGERGAGGTSSRAEQRSEAFQKWLGEGLTRTLVAARGREISARTGGLILAQIVFDLTRAGGRADRVLDAPTNEAWIDPWVAHLRGRGVDLRLNAPVQGLTVRDGRISGVTTPAGTVTADHYVAALPVEVMRQLAGPPLRALDPAFARPRPARDALDERRAVLPRPRRAARARPRRSTSTPSGR